jgi:hypothetical protein
MGITFLEWIGYAASVTIAISMAMSSFVKFRVINLVGAALFSIYGFLIGSIPVGILNGFIVAVDIYYLAIIFSKKDVFETLEVRSENRYLERFLQYYSNDINRFFPGYKYAPTENTLCFLVLRNMSVAGVLVAQKEEGGVLYVELDYIIPELRDFKNGSFLYQYLNSRVKEMGFQRLVSKRWSKKHDRYLTKLGFSPNSDNFLEKNL